MPLCRSVLVLSPIGSISLSYNAIKWNIIDKMLRLFQTPFYEQKTGLGDKRDRDPGAQGAGQERWDAMLAFPALLPWLFFRRKIPSGIAEGPSLSLVS